ncbi:DUF1178 family protein [Limnohabitans sp. MMS-10A-178]|uniref:DUF1178 family protein n=1 Tax=Limnohabitans sp. MMS-10A-178 TaxID=1835767 RepID=UPI000D39C1C0|nr:DUF1178 family protein [Limnohabitans sp. MMS-10A-178]PUE17139.1 hypothetical protein B9Z32_06315 [Limnohabitans sp. MMS-10A-178]
MKVLNLQCAGMHTFEGWFGSEDDYQSQRERNLVACPLCANTEVRKLPSAPRLNFGAEEPRQAKSAAKEDSSAVAGPVAPAGGLPALPTLPTVPNAEAKASSLSQMHPEAVEMVQEAWMKMVKHVIANTEDVGQNFAEEARKMHYGESEERNIRGQASMEETQDLLEEGIEVMPLPVPDALKGGLQ